MQTTRNILMIRPVNFGYNPETAVNNAFQEDSRDPRVQEKALREFDDFTARLKAGGINVLVVEDTLLPFTPDSIFPNNWLSFHNDGTVVLYPMFAPNRRLERKEQVIETVNKHFEIKGTIDLTGFEKEDIFLEGTGSMVLDRENKIAYACLSPRTNENALQEFCRLYRYKPVCFEAADENGILIYHTNVMMCVADRYAVICLESIRNENERMKVSAEIAGSGKEIIPITFQQVQHFAGNMLQVENDKGEKILVMSSQAFHSLTPSQLSRLESFNTILHSPIDTIEKNGGGSARCMMAEIHL